VLGRLRVSANLKGLAFPERLDTPTLEALGRQLLERIGGEWPITLSLGRPDDSQWEFLSERWLQEPARFAVGGARLLLEAGESRGLLLGGHDHLRFCVRGTGETLRAGAEAIEARLGALAGTPGLALEAGSGERIVANPFHCGSGAHVSLVLHLPGLCWWGRLEETLDPLYAEGLAYRTWQDGFGDFLVIENVRAEGHRDSRRTLEDLFDLLRDIEAAEDEACEELLAHRRLELEDRIWRAAATCRSARLMGYPELVEHLSMLRLGRQLALAGEFGDPLPGLEITPWLLRLAPAHLARSAGRPLDGRGSSAMRAVRLREALGGAEGSIKASTRGSTA
jgi:protein arginine kinase